MPNDSGWALLGDALGGDSEIEYQKGLNLGANTENALAQASDRRAKAKAQQELSGQLKTAGFAAADADAASGALTAGGGLGDIFTARKTNQEVDLRGRASNPASTFTDRNIALQGLAPSPVNRYQVENGVIDDRFDETPAAVSPGGSGGGKSAFTQNATLFDMIDPATGKIREGVNPTTGKTYREDAYAILRNSERGADAGGVPQTVNTNPFSPGHGAATPVVSAQEVGQNAAAIQANKDLPAAFSRFRNQTAQADLVTKNIDDALAKTDWTSAGPMQTLTGWAPWTPAGALQQTVTSIKANVGFQQLQQMRYESPTGGALGQVAVQELDFLQAALGSLNAAQTPADLSKTLNDVRDHYTRFKAFASQDYELAQARSQTGQTPGNGTAPNFHPAPGAHSPPSGAPPGGVPITPTSAAPRTFNTIEEAEAAGLDDGTPIIVGGRKATWRN